MSAKRAAEGLELMAIGGVLLANTVGGLPWSVWLSILSLWPIWLIAAGIDLIGKSTDRTWVRVLSSMLMIASLLYGAFVMVPGTWGFPFVIRSGGPAQSVSQSERHAAAVDHGTARISVGATELTVEGGTDLAALSGDGPVGLEPRLTSTIVGSAADVKVDYPRSSTVWTPGSSNNRLLLSLDKTVRWERMELNAGATKASIDLGDLMVDRLDVNVGAADVAVTFAEGRDCRAVVKGGVANVTVRVPERSEVTVHAQGLLNTDTPDGFQRTGDWGSRTWTHAGGGSGVIDISVEGGIANLKVETY